MAFQIVLMASVLALVFCLPIVSSGSQPAKWDYVAHPVKVTENQKAPLGWLGLRAASAFDGYGAQGSKPAAVRGWRQLMLPTDESPIACEVDYGEPVAVSAFVHYFYVPGCRDLRFLAPGPAAFKRVRISAKQEDGDWKEIATLNDLPSACPQVIPLKDAAPARFWRIEALEMAPGAEAVISYEIETWTGGVPDVRPAEIAYPDLPAQFAKRIRSHKPASGPVSGTLSLKPGGKALALTLSTGGKSVQGEVQLVVDKETRVLSSEGENAWRWSNPGGDTVIECKPTAMGLLLEARFVAKPDNPVKYQRAALQMTTPKADLYYIPAYEWSRKPLDVTPNSANVQTRLIGLGCGDMMLCYVPGTDRGSLGILSGAASNNLLLGPEPTPVLLAAVKGDWWTAYQFAVNDVFGFEEQPQSTPVSEIQYGISRYMLSEEVWEPTLGTVKSWPARDPHNTVTKIMDCFQFYGSTYSIPTYWARYVMNGDKLALDRMRSIARWMLNSGVHVKDGPMAGAFFNLQRFRTGEERKLDQQGATQASQHILTCQSTGTALWTLLYYRTVTGDTDPEITRAIDQSADWLLKQQKSDGGWPYAFQVDGTAVPGAPSSGSIWNIWGLWRLGKQTGDRRYLDAAERAKNWFAREFVQEHHYHGYWEDVGPGSREGYEAGIAAVAFGEMGEKELAVATARDAMQWVFTRQIECREPGNSAGLVAEQTGWPPASYCNPMMGLAAHTAWRITGSDSWRPFALIPKAIGWWYQPETGAMVWIVDAPQMAPIVGPSFESWWCDWCIAQVGTLSLRWLVREVDMVSSGAVALNEDSLHGTAFGKNVHAWAPPGGLRPVMAGSSQANWLGLRGSDSIMVAFVNRGPAGDVSCSLDSRDVEGAALWPKSVHYITNGKTRSEKWDGLKPAKVGRDAVVVMEWGICP